MYFQVRWHCWKDDSILLITEYSNKDEQRVGFIRNSLPNEILKWKMLS